MLYLAISICLLLLLLATVVRSKMAKIKTYNNATTPLSGGDKVIGTEATDDSTKNFTVQDIADFTLNPANGSVVNSVTGSSDVSATPTTGGVSVGLTDTTVVAGEYDYATVTVDSKGRVTQATTGTPVTSLNTLDGSIAVVAGDGTSVITNASTNTITINSTGSGGSGSVTQVIGGTGLDTSPAGGITTTGTINLADTTVTADTYTNPTIDVDAQGRITDASNGPTIDLQYVLNNGGVANSGSITLTGGGVIAPTGVVGALSSSTITVLDLTLSESLVDGNGATGTLGQVLVSDPTLNGGVGGVVWSNVDTSVSKVTVSSAALNAATPVTVVPAPGAGKYIQVVSASAKYDYGTSTYSFAAPLKLYSNSSIPQFELDENFLLLPADQTRAMSLTTSGALDENTAIFFAPASIPTVQGDGIINLNVQYRIVDF
jgi:hypothetical protein